MAVYRVKFSCGHGDEVRLFGPERDRQRQLEWLAREGLCADCRRAKEEAAGPQFYVRATQEGIEYVCWSASFSIKDELKARGWQFSREVYPPPTKVRDLVALCRSARPGWRVLFRKDNPNFQEAVLAERDWIRQNGWTLEVLMPAISLLSAPVEGRADLIT